MTWWKSGGAARAEGAEAPEIELTHYRCSRLLDLPRLREFCAHVIIPSRDHGLIPMTPLFTTQEYILQEINAGLEADVHDFVVLKGGRQIGGSTIFDALTLFYLQEHAGLNGMLVSDDDSNRDYRRDVLLQMHASLPKAWRWPIRMSNRGALAWAPPNGSRLLFDAAGLRPGSNLGRSKGLNVLYADEVGSWPDQQAISALQASLSETHPLRLSLWVSTARGFNAFHAMWTTAETAVKTRAIFVAWWRHAAYRIEREQRELWDAYGARRMTAEERQWVREIRKRYAVELEPEQLVWYRWKLDEQFYGDEAMMAQEFACLPGDAFQAFGDKFIPPPTLQRLRIALGEAPTATNYQYAWGETLDASGIERCDPKDATLRIWEEPDNRGVYVLGAHPAHSSSSHGASAFVIQVWRVWPDAIVQVAEFADPDMATYQFAWAILHLAGAYRTLIPAYFILEIGGTGYRVLEEIQLLQQHGYGLSPSARKQNLHDFLGAVSHYFFFRPDNVSSKTAPIEWKTGPNNRPWLLHGLRDTIERGHMTIRSAALLDELAALRRAESGDADEIKAGGTILSDSRAVCAALSVEVWLRTAMPDLPMLTAPKEPLKPRAATVGEHVVASYLGRLLATGRP